MKKIFRRKFGGGKTKKGVASFYIVAFSTLILVVIATSFAMVIVSEMTRTANNDLSDSAYDSVLSGTEDAKMAYVSYMRCKEQGVTAPRLLTGGSNVTCEDIMYWMENPDCYTVGHILGKIEKNNSAEVELGTKTGKSGISINQAYTCAKIDVNPPTIRQELDANHAIRITKVKIEGSANDVKKIKLSWSAVRNDAKLNFANVSSDLNRVKFAKMTTDLPALPPTIEFRMVQTGPTFSMNDFDKTAQTVTNRATLYLVPAPRNWRYNSTDRDNYFSTNNNEITVEQVAQSNDRAATKKPFLIKCGDEKTTSDFYCEAVIDMPNVVGGSSRNDDTFAVAVSLPYQKPETDFTLEFLCSDSTTCASASHSVDATTGMRVATTRDTQIEVDVTGRANDLYRRVRTTFNTKDTTFNASYPFYTLQVLGDSGVEKNMTVTSEWNFDF